jgi:hypothetical protein
MSGGETVLATAAQAAEMLQGDLDRARLALQAGNLDPALDGYVRALGLALQLGPAPAERALAAILSGALTLAQSGQAEGLSTLGPAMVGLVHQVREAGALPATGVMDAWATIASDLGAFIGQVGVALTIPAERRAGMVKNLRAHAALLDEATGEMFGLVAWLDGTGA